MSNQYEINEEFRRENAELRERLDRLEAQNPGPARNNVPTLPGNEFLFQDMGEGEVFTWQGHTWKKTAPHHAECQESFRQYIPDNDVVVPVAESKEVPDVEDQPEHPESEESRPDRTPSLPG